MNACFGDFISESFQKIIVPFIRYVNARVILFVDVAFCDGPLISLVYNEHVKPCIVYMGNLATANTDSSSTQTSHGTFRSTPGIPNVHFPRNYTIPS